MLKYYTYKKLMTGTISFDYNDIMSVTYRQENRRDYRNKVAYFTESTALAHGRIHWKTELSHNPADGLKLYVYPECSISRDIYRKSGYTITRDKTKADVRVVPQILASYPTLSFDFGVYNKDTETLSLLYYDYSCNSISKKTGVPIKLHTDKIKERFKGDSYELINDDCCLRSIVEFLPDGDAYKDIIDDSSALYVEEYDVKVTSVTQISLETLKIWKKMSFELLTQSICNSNWMEYPMTLNMFLSDCGYHFSSGTQMRGILKQIEFDNYGHTDFNGWTIQPQDWNLAQEYLCDKLGVPKEGGFSSEPFTGLRSFNSMIRQRLAVKPLYITEPAKYEELISLL